MNTIQKWRWGLLGVLFIILILVWVQVLKPSPFVAYQNALKELGISSTYLTNVHLKGNTLVLNTGLPQNKLSWLALKHPESFMPAQNLVYQFYKVAVATHPEWQSMVPKANKIQVILGGKQNKLVFEYPNP